jgi:hypothetical protein
MGLIPRSNGLSLMVERAGSTGAAGTTGEGVTLGIARNLVGVPAKATTGAREGVSKESQEVGCIELATDDATKRPPEEYALLPGKCAWLWRYPPYLKWLRDSP